jgi:RecB family exonuclease
MDLKLSYSKISTYLQCPYRYYLSYVVKLPTLPKPYFSFGHTIHSVLEWIHKPRVVPVAITEQEMLDRYAMSWETKGYQDIDEEAQYRDIGRSMLLSYWSKHDGQFKPAFEVEKRFEFIDERIENVILTGVIDRIDILESGAVTLLDYKTGKWIPGSIEEMDKLQLIIYAMASRRLLNKRVSKAGYYFLRCGKEFSFEPDEDQFSSTLSMIGNVAKGIKAGDFPVQRNRFCAWCDYNNRCQSTPVLSIKR